MRGMMSGPDRPGAAPARMACAVLLSCALAACGGSGGRLLIGSIEDEEAVDVLAAEGLTVAAGANGSVRAAVDGGGAVTVAAGSQRGFTVIYQSEATLTAVAADGYRFAGWTLSAGLACGVAPARICELAAGSIYDGASASVAFRLLGPPPDPAAWRGPGSVSVSVSRNGAVQTAVPFVPGAFERWEGAPCDGSEDLACDVSSVTADEGLPVAVFRPFAVDGIKSLAFGLGGYHAGAPDHFRVSFRDAMGGGFTPVPGLESLTPGPEPARLSVSVHLLPWGLGAYLTETCDSNSCKEADGGRRALEQPDSVAATGYFKAPNAGSIDIFGSALALSADGATLAVGAPGEDGKSTGALAPTDDGYQAALDSGDQLDDGERSCSYFIERAPCKRGAVYVYRRSGSEWSLEAFVKAPKVDFEDGFGGSADRFGSTLALSAGGATLAVGAPGEDSASIGTFTPVDNGYQAALESRHRNDSGAAYVYRRSGAGRWGIEAFVKAPNTSGDDKFGRAIALSADGATLAVGAPYQDSASTGAFTALTDDGYQAALESSYRRNSGAAYVYRRSGAGRWGIEAFVKAPNAGEGDEFGSALALDSSGTTLAVGALWEDGKSTGTFAPVDDGYQAALDSGGDLYYNSGAAYVYRRSNAGRWGIEAFVKAPKAGADDRFGRALALDSSGSTLAVGASWEDGKSTGAFAPSDDGYQAALDNNGDRASGAAYVYRRSSADRWGIEAFIKAPNAGSMDIFGSALTLSADGATLAVGAPWEDGKSTGAFAPTDDGYQAALDSDSAFDNGAAYVYRRSGAGRWGIEAFVKAPNAGEGDEFGSALALSANGSALAVGAYKEYGSALPRPVGGDSADAGNFVYKAGAVYLY